MNVYDQAHGLAKAIKASGEFMEYDALKKQVDANPQLAQKGENCGLWPMPCAALPQCHTTRGTR